MTRRRSAAPAGACSSSNLNESEVRVMTASPGASTRWDGENVATAVDLPVVEPH